MNKAYTVTDANGDYRNIKKSYKPKNYVGETPIDPVTGEYEDEASLVLVDKVDEFGETYQELVADETKKAAVDFNKEMEANRVEADEYMNELRSAKDDTAYVIKALVEQAGGDSTKITQIERSIRYLEFADYKEEYVMGLGKYNAIVFVDGIYLIQQFDRGSKPSNFIRLAPPGFLPGDENFLTHKSGKEFDIDIEGRLAKFNTMEKSAEKARGNDVWNEDSPLERIKKSFLGK